jgi:hypothetical protein
MGLCLAAPVEAATGVVEPIASAGDRSDPKAIAILTPGDLTDCS